MRNASDPPPALLPSNGRGEVDLAAVDRLLDGLFSGTLRKRGNGHRRSVASLMAALDALAATLPAQHETEVVEDDEPVRVSVPPPLPSMRARELLDAPRLETPSDPPIALADTDFEHEASHPAPTPLSEPPAVEVVASADVSGESPALTLSEDETPVVVDERPATSPPPPLSLSGEGDKPAQVDEETRAPAQVDEEVLAPSLLTGREGGGSEVVAEEPPLVLSEPLAEAPLVTAPSVAPSTPSPLPPPPVAAPSTPPPALSEPPHRPRSIFPAVSVSKPPSVAPPAGEDLSLDLSPLDSSPPPAGSVPPASITPPPITVVPMGSITPPRPVGISPSGQPVRPPSMITASVRPVSLDLDDLPAPPPRMAPSAGPFLRPNVAKPDEDEVMELETVELLEDETQKLPAHKLAKLSPRPAMPPPGVLGSSMRPAPPSLPPIPRPSKVGIPPVKPLSSVAPNATGAATPVRPPPPPKKPDDQK